MTATQAADAAVARGEAPERPRRAADIAGVAVAAALFVFDAGIVGAAMLGRLPPPPPPSGCLRHIHDSYRTARVTGSKCVVVGYRLLLLVSKLAGLMH